MWKKLISGSVHFNARYFTFDYFLRANDLLRALWLHLLDSHINRLWRRWQTKWMYVHKFKSKFALTHTHTQIECTYGFSWILRYSNFQFHYWRLIFSFLTWCRRRWQFSFCFKWDILFLNVPFSITPFWFG